MDLYIVEHLKPTLITTMIISEIIKLRSNEKKECKITGNGVIWLKKGEYGKKVSGKCLEPKTVTKEALTYNQILTNETKKITNELGIINLQSINGGANIHSGQEVGKTARSNHYTVNKRKVRSRLTNFMNSEQGCKAMYFYTLSFPSQINYNTAYKLLNSTLTTLRKDHGLKHYLWIAERQKRGTIHYHIAIFQHIKVRIVNDIVKKYLKHSIRLDNINWSITAANNYNGVDIAKDRKTRIPTNFADKSKVKKISSYITKYVTKGNDNFDRQAWNSSRSLAAVSDGICCSVYEIVSMFNNEILSDSATYANEWCMFFPWKKEAPPDYLKLMYDINTDRIKKVA